VDGMTTTARRHILHAIAEDELWVARARALITTDSDCTSIEESIAKAQRQVDRMRAQL